MSERGSFVTEYIFCPKCLKAVKEILLCKSKWLCSQQIDTWDSIRNPIPIVAGKVGGLYSNEELIDFSEIYIPALSKLICHPLRIAVLAENGERIFRIEPVTKQKSNGCD